ncbi:ABC transporter permease subunit [Jatrophihabitans lederbergiae]|uniref:ABC transporter permease subunit n=1 Tax=Jatrophihabitans lederbergiae TaxID=3075547 RepID=A0ABU2JBJ3_9ACTN|nr:ABC transporter permease subunit [Jatrophihabitans sp. DSM 44399]MDT0262029.1 ABC transporter permease subunit [Jatrophihabitans sp. DSM 44399]
MTSTVTQQPIRPTVTPRFSGMKVTQGRVIKSEWTKFRSLRSTLITLVVSVILTIGLGTLISAVTASHWSQSSPGDRADFNAVVTSLDGIRFSQLAVGVLGVLLISGEYATGMIRASLTAVPKRLPVLWAKLSVFTGVVGIISIISTFIAFFLGQAMLSSQHLQVTISSPDALRMVAGAGIYVLLVGLIGMALGGLMRNTAAGISSLVALFFVIPPVLNLLPKSWANNIGPYLPSNAGESFWGHPNGVHLSALAGLLVLCGWTAAAIAAAAVRLKSQDA